MSLSFLLTVLYLCATFSSTIILSKSPKLSTHKAQKIYTTTENVAATLTLAIETDAEWPLVDIPTSSFVLVEQRALQGTHDFVFAIGDCGKQSRLGRPRLCQAGWIQEGSISPDLHEGYLRISSFNISKDIFRLRTVRLVCLSYRIALVPTLDPDTTHLYGNRRPPLMTRRSSTSTALAPVFNRVYHGMWETKLPVMSEVTDLDFFYGGAIGEEVDHPQLLMYPVYPSFSQDVLRSHGRPCWVPCRGVVVG
jgi:hypothetical protein